MTAVTAPERVLKGQPIEVRYTVENRGGDTITDQGSWSDLIYVSRDEFLDLRGPLPGECRPSRRPASGRILRHRADRKTAARPGGTVLRVVVTDAGWHSVIGLVRESDERNNSRPSAVPLLIDYPPPTDLTVSDIIIPGDSKSGDPISIAWTVTNASSQPAAGRWVDAVYLSADGAWDLADRLLGRVEHNEDLLAAQTYTATLPTVIPAVAPGEYRVIVRTDIFNQVYEQLGELNNRTVSDGSFAVTVDALQLGVPLPTTLSTGQERVFALQVPDDKTLSVELFGTGEQAANEVFLRWGAVPTGTVYDAAYQGRLAPSQTAIVPATEGGTYYVLVRGYREPAENTPVTLLAPPLAAGHHERRLGRRRRREVCHDNHHRRAVPRGRRRQARPSRLGGIRTGQLPRRKQHEDHRHV